MSDNETTIGISDLVKVRLEIHWQEAKWKQLKKEAKLKGKPLNKDLLTPEEVAESYHESVRKKDKNADFDEQLKRETVEGHPAVTDKWYWGSSTGYEAIWYCGVSDRYYMLRYADGEDYASFKSLLSTVVCHSSLVMLRWRYLGLDLQLPRDYYPYRQKAEVGKLSIVFVGQWKPEQKARRTLSWIRPPPLPHPRRLIVERVNTIRMGNLDVKSWMVEDSYNLMRKYVGNPKIRYGPKGVKVNGHDGYYALLSVGGGLFGHSKSYYSLYGWSCPQTSSAYILINPLPPGKDWYKETKGPQDPPDYVTCHKD